MLATLELTDLRERERGLYADEEKLRRVGLSSDRYPQSIEEFEIADRILNEELGKYSWLEHEQAVFDVHGLPLSDNEDPPNIDMYLNALERELQRIQTKEAYNLAKSMKEEYVKDRSFLLMFLRRDLFDPKLAAQRIVFHFEMKRVLFGDGEILVRDICLSDLSDSDIVALESGFFQALPQRDAAGRLVLVAAPMLCPSNATIDNCQRAKWYFLNMHLKDEETQRKGVVLVAFNSGESAQPEQFELIRACENFRTAIPCKTSGVHYCFGNPALKPFITVVQLSLDKESLKRFRVHFGSTNEIIFELQTCGIPVEGSYIEPDGSIAPDNHKGWMADRKALEKDKAPIDGAIVPRRFDVLFGRGRDVRVHTGNLRAIHIVEMLLDDYTKAGRHEKTAISERVIGIIYDSNGRFLKWEGGSWIEVDYSAARDKISHLFRDSRRRVIDYKADSISTDNPMFINTSLNDPVKDLENERKLTGKQGDLTKTGFNGTLTKVETKRRRTSKIH